VVIDLQVYTKSESSASLRWKPPYPPTGVLQKYQIEYDKGYLNETRYKNEFEMTSCNVSNLKSRAKYTFEVRNLNLLEVVILKLLLMYR
jgi:hypothetical protein